MAKAKYIRISPFKVRIVLDIIRGKSFVEARAILKNTVKAANEPILKVLESAAANAQNNLGMNKNDLYVAECYADQGPTLKRFNPVSKGRAHSILKRTSHITVILDTVNK
ncbi:MAG: 50S ribosomal protein L22 [Clostridia bacterium]|nr:50S ribosomal protein L22 [Clostridia bacterium]MBR7159812.1 50S ribosomal protein L22 [Clostridia bacterium]